jgi:hypothetical protein
VSEPRGGAHPSILFRSAFVFGCVGFLVWLVISWSGYGRKYAEGGHGWRIGGTQLIEISLTSADEAGLACASDAAIEGLRCGYTANAAPVPDMGDARTLRPYNTTKNELFLGAGLWTSLPRAKIPKASRFSAFCNYEIVGAMKSVSIRFGAGAAFGPTKQSTLVGSLSDCVIPE